MSCAELPSNKVFCRCFQYNWFHWYLDPRKSFLTKRQVPQSFFFLSVNRPPIISFYIFTFHRDFTAVLPKQKEERWTSKCMDFTMRYKSALICLFWLFQAFPRIQSPILAEIMPSLNISSRNQRGFRDKRPYRVYFYPKFTWGRFKISLRSNCKISSWNFFALERTTDAINFGKKKMEC